MEFCGEIQYSTDSGNVHSDICHHKENPIHQDYRSFLHACLDEWLDKSQGNGSFWIGDPQYFYSWEKENNP